MIQQILLTSVVLGSGLAVVSQPRAPVPQDDKPAFTADVVKQALSIEVELSGTFVAENKDEIRMEPEAYRGDLIITSLLAEGTEVQEGDILIEFDPSSLERSLEDASNEATDKQVAMAKAKADLEAFQIERETTLKVNAKELALAQAELDKASEQAALELADKEKSIVDAENSLADARIDFEQLTQLYKERELHTATENILIAREKRRVANSERSLQRTKQEVVIWKKYDHQKPIAEKELEVLKKDSELKQAEIKLAADTAEKEAEVKKAQRALDKANREVDELSGDQSGLRVLAPRAGIVFYGTIGGDMFSDVIVFGMGDQGKEMQVGGRVRTHQTLMTVASMDQLSVEMKVLENDIQHMQPGLPVTIRPDAFPSLAIDGTLTTVDKIASRTGFMSEVREFTVRGQYEGVFKQLRSGMNCRVTVHADTVPDAVQVPVLAVYSQGGEFYCLVQGRKKTERRPVKLGATNGTMVEITEGLRPGERVSLWDPNAD